MDRRLARRVVFVAGLLLLTLCIGTAGFHLIEGYSLFEAFYETLTTITTVGTTRTVTHHPANHPALRGLGRRCAVIVAATMERAMGTTKTAPLTNADRTGRPRQRSRGALRFDFLRAISIVTVPTRPMCYDSPVSELSSACAPWR